MRSLARFARRWTRGAAGTQPVEMDAAVMHRIATSVGLDVASTRIDAAGRASTFVRMRELEVELGRPYKSEGPEVALLRLGYETDPDWAGVRGR